MRNLIGIVALSLLAAVAGCASDDTSSKTTSTTTSDPNDPFASLEQNLDRFTGACSVDAAGIMTVSPVTGGVTIISKNIVTSQIMANGQDCGAATVTKRIVVAGGGGNDTVIVDYTNGLFAVGAVATSTAIDIDLGAGTDTVGIKGTSAVDKVTMGKSTDGLKYTADMNTDGKADVYILKANVDAVKVHLGAGNDTYSGGAFASSSSDLALTVYGGDGDDSLVQPAALTYNEVLEGGNGTDTVTYAARTSTLPVTVTMLSGADDGSSGELDNIGLTVEVVTGTPGADNMTANATTSTLNGGPGADTLLGGAGNNTINGDADNDTITGALGNDTLSGGAGDDTFVEQGSATSTGADVFNGGAGTDTVDYSTRTAVLTVTMDGAAANDGQPSELDNVKGDIENLICGTGNDIITGNALSNTITGGLGNDSINGGAGHDTFVEGALTSGADTLIGAAGTDTVDYSLRSTAVVVTMDGSTSSGQASENDGVGADVENCYGGTGADTITGNAFDNLLFGGDGNDVLDGAAGNDELDGGSSTVGDILTGGAGDGDTCYAQAVSGTPGACEF